MQPVAASTGRGAGGDPRGHVVLTGGDQPMPDLSGRRILLVEDDFCIAWNVLEALEDAGATVEGPSSSADGVRTLLLHSRPDAATVDINLGEGPTFRVAEMLRERGIPFLFATGYDTDGIPHDFRDVPVIGKPFDVRQLLAMLGALVDTPPAS